MPTCKVRCAELVLSLTLLSMWVSASSLAFAQDQDFDEYKVRITAFWMYSTPTVTMEAAGHNGRIDFNRDFDFNNYSTGFAKLDWKFARKHHLYFVFAPFQQSRERAITRTITFRGQTFTTGLVTKGEFRATVYGPGYQYDIVRRKRGHLGIAVQFNIFDTKGTLSAAAQVTSGGTQHASTYTQGSLLAPIPVGGPEFRFYFNRRFYAEGNVYGMYFFGYGNYLSTIDSAGVAFSKHLSAKAGYSMVSRLRVNDGHNRIGLDFTQKGPIVGLDLTF